jgi:type II secretory pathway pseudopilin PulG
MSARRPNRSVQRRVRAGMALVEVLIVLAILIAVAAITIPMLSSYFQLEQHRVAKELTLTYSLLRDQAVMRNVTFRIAYHLDENYYEIEVGDARTLIFDDPAMRDAWEKDREDRLSRFSDDERAAALADESGGFQAARDRFQTRVELPSGSRFGGVYTPQYEEMMVPSGADPAAHPEDLVVVHSYIMPNGFSEQTIVLIVDEDDPTAGYAVEVEPMSGAVHLDGDLEAWKDRFDFLPEQGPELDP